MPFQTKRRPATHLDRQTDTQTHRQTDRHPVEIYLPLTFHFLRVYLRDILLQRIVFLACPNPQILNFYEHTKRVVSLTKLLRLIN